jgi:hypothetical protein
VKSIIDDFNLLIEWLQSFFLLTPISDPPARECFVARFQASKYTLDEARIGSTRPNGKTFELYACNCPTFIHYCLCKHC